jgi:hypothetical protein
MYSHIIYGATCSAEENERQHGLWITLYAMDGPKMLGLGSWNL